MQSSIGRMVKRIVKKFHPEKVILFGSHARQEAGPDSDVDLLIVMPVEGSKLDKAVEIAVALGDLPVPGHHCDSSRRIRVAERDHWNNRTSRRPRRENPV